MSRTSQPCPALSPEDVLAHDASVRRLARSLLGEAHADDLAQEAWAAALETGPDRVVSLPAWLARVTRFLAHKRRRADSRREHRHRAVARPEGVPSTAAIVEREAVRADVVRAVLELPEPYRSTMVLRYFEERRPREIARELGVPVETVRTRLKRALQVLRARLDREHGGSRNGWSLALLPLAGRPRALLPVAASTGLLLMTAKAKLFSAGAVALGVFLVLWATVLGPGGQPLDPPPSEGTAPIVAAEVGEEKKTDAPRTEEPEAKRTADPVPEKPTHGSLEVRVVHHDDTPAPDVLIVLYRQGVDDEFLTPEKMTGAEGTVLFEELAPGRVFPHPRQASNTFGNATVEAGKRTVETIKLPRGCDVTGVVVDSAGKPVPGADVLVAPWAQHLAWPVAETDARGRFSLRGIGTHFHVGARARGFAPSVLQQLQGSEGGEIELRVELPGAGGAAVVSVEGPDGKPVRGALVEIGSRKSVNRSIRLASGASARRPHPQRRRTEATGRATFAGLEPGTHPVGVRAVGAAFWSGEITIHAKGSEEVLARLVEPVTIEGTVTTYAGAPAPKVDIQVGSWDSFENFRTTTAADGSYRLTDLAPGEFTVTARDGNRANVKKQLTAVAGQTLRWDTKLPAGMKILGRVVDERGKGMKGKRIEATLMRFNKGDTWFGHAVTDKEGRFVLKGCLPGRGVRIDVRGGMFPRARVEDVKPGGAEVLIRLTDASKPSVHLTGKVVLPDGKPAQNVQVSCFRGTGGSSGVHTTGVDGTFKLGPYSPGEFTLSLRPNGYPRVRKKTGELVPDETWNGGTIELVQGGHCVVTVRDASGNTVPELDAELRDDKGAWVDRLKIENGKGRSVPIAPGTYLLCVFGKDVAHQAVGFVVSPGVDVPIPVTVARGIPVKVRIAFPEGVKANNTLLRVTDANGRAVAYTGAWRQGRAAAKTLRLTPGRYRVRATVGSALSAEREVTVNDGGEATVELTLGR